MTEEEQEKLYELLFKDTKNKLEETIEEQQNKIASLKKQIKLMQNCDLAKVIKKQEKEIEALELIHETYKEVIEDIENRYISKDKIKNKIKELEQIKATALTNRTIEMMNDKISILNLILKENNKCK